MGKCRTITFYFREKMFITLKTVMACHTSKILFNTDKLKQLLPKKTYIVA